MVLVSAVALACGFLTNHLRDRFLLWATALGGAAVVVNAVGRLISGLDELHQPRTVGQHALAVLAWLAVAVAGWLVQRRIFARRLEAVAH